jgi:hypothetical protein
MENVSVFYDNLEQFAAISYILWSLGIGSLWSCGLFFLFWYFSRFGFGGPRKIWQPCSRLK